MRELVGLKQLVSSFESKNKVNSRQEQAVAYKALQKEHSALLEERKKDHKAATSLRPEPGTPPNPPFERDEPPQTRDCSSPVTVPSQINAKSESLSVPIPPSIPLSQSIPKSSVPFRLSAVQTLSSLEQKFSKLQSDRNSLQQSLSGLKGTESVQERGRKHALEMELGMIDSTIAMLVEKIGRYRKSAEVGK